MKFRSICATLAVAALFAPAAHATNVPLAGDGSWNEFTVDNLAAPAFGNG